MKINSLQRFHHPECPPRPNYRTRLFCLFMVWIKKKKVAKISLDDQILLFIVQREAIVDITGTL